MGEGVLHQNDLVPIGGLHAGDAASATVLGSEGIVVHAFDIPVAGKGNDDILLRDNNSAEALFLQQNLQFFLSQQRQYVLRFLLLSH